MKVINILLPLFTFLAGLLYSEFSRFMAQRRGDKKKLKRLLFHLLEIHSLIRRLFNFDERFDLLMNEAPNYMSDFMKDVVSKEDLAKAKLMLAPLLKAKLIDKERLEYLVKNIDGIIDEVSEIEPFLAFELADQYNISARLSEFEAFIEDCEAIMLNHKPETSGSQLLPSDLNLTNISVPLISKAVKEKLESHILTIARRINRKAIKDARNVLKDDGSKQILEDMKESLTESFSQIETQLIAYYNQVVLKSETANVGE